MALRVKQEVVDQIRAHGEETYPHECCGFLLGTVEDGSNVLLGIYKAENEWIDREGAKTPDGRVESRANRYLITPAQYKRADDSARAEGFGIIGYYHSHPDHPAVPSGFDLDHSCWPGESYVIVSVEKGRATVLNSFSKPNYDKFEREEVLLERD
ncbi:MAG TPA: M67 family metallopeptidase [Blastocatellia bacterium]|nr:M67 family metallopeptidase [Blastocatellia bacterium]